MGQVTGYDMTAALAMADALGISKIAVVELLPLIETEMVRASINDQTGTVPGDWEND